MFFLALLGLKVINPRDRVSTINNTPLGCYGELIRSDQSIFSLYLYEPVCLFVCFVALCPKSTAMVMTGQSVHLITFFPGQA